MTVVARRIRATPERGASDAWQVIVDLIAPKDGTARRELLSIEGIASSIISTQSPKDVAMVVRGHASTPSATGAIVDVHRRYVAGTISDPFDGDSVIAFTEPRASDSGARCSVFEST
jgi:hypothetical protein